MFRRAEPGDVTELSGERSAEDRADTVDLLDGLITGVAFEYRSDPSIQFGDLGVVELDETTQRPHPVFVCVGHVGVIQPDAAAGTPQMADWWQQAFRTQYWMHVSFQPGPQLRRFPSVADQLPLRPHRLRWDPRLRQTSHSQKISQQPGIDPVVLHPPGCT